MSEVEPALLRRIEELADGAGGSADEITVVHDVHGELAALREDVAALRSEVREATGNGEALADVVRTALEERMATLEDALDTVTERLEARAVDGIAGTTDRIEALRVSLSGLTDRLEQTGADRDEALAALREEMASVDALASAVREAVSDLGRAVDHSLGALSGSLSQAFSESRDSDRRRVEGAVAEVHDLVAQVSSLVEQRRQAPAQEASELHETLARFEQAQAASRTMVEEEIAALRSDLADALEEIRDRVTTSVVEQVAALGMGSTVDRLREETSTALDELRLSIDDATGSMRGASDGLSSGTQRLATIGQGLLAYLAERERVLEAERDRVLHDLLDEFADGLTAKERRWLSGRLGDALERRRDARDAGKWRDAADRRALSEPPQPPDLEVFTLDAGPAPAPAPAAPAKRTSARKSAAPAKPATAAKRAAAAKPAAAKAAPTSAAKQPAAVKQSAAKQASRPGPRRRARVDGVPDVPSPHVALQAATGEPATPAAAPEAAERASK